ncbi:MAG: VWA domain-containing protein, partial [Gemmatimonadota bacterium]
MSTPFDGMAIDWARPDWLYALVLVPLAIGALVVVSRSRRRALDRFAEPAVRERTQSLPAGQGPARGALLAVGLTALVLAAAGPRWGTERTVAPPVGQQIVLALDVSRSMLAEDMAPSRLERAKFAIRQLLVGLPAAEVGLVVFAGEAALVVPLTRDADAIELYLATAGPDWISDPSTDLTNAVGVALDAFGPVPGPGRAIALFSDGEDQTGSGASAAAAARERGVQIIAIGVGTPEGARIPDGDGGWLEAGGEVVVTRLEPDPLVALAEGTAGRYVPLGAGDAGMAEIGARLQALDSGRKGGASGAQRAERYRWPLAVALLCLAGEAALRRSGSRRPDEGSLHSGGERKDHAMASRRPAPAAAVLAALTLVAMGQSASPTELYEDGRYQEALAAWRHADRQPGAQPVDAYNRGNAAYRLGEMREAAAGYAVAARTAEARVRAEAAWYNAGNARYRLAEAAEQAADPGASARWDSAVAAYREALLRDPADADAKHNLE